MKIRSFGSRGRGLLGTLVIAVSLTASVDVFAQVIDRTVAVIRLTETVSISARGFQSAVERYEGQLGRQLTSSQRRTVLETMINEELLLQAARRAGIRVSEAEVDVELSLERGRLGPHVSEEQFRLMIEEQFGMSFTSYRKQVREEMTRSRYVQRIGLERFEGLPEPSEEEISAVYSENVEQFVNPEMARLEHVYVDLAELAGAQETERRDRLAALEGRIRRGRLTFDEAMELAEEEHWLESGDLGYLPKSDPLVRAQLGAEFVDAVSRLDVDEVSTVLESNVGVHIVRVSDRLEPRLLGLNDPIFPGESVTVRENIAAYIMNLRAQEYFQREVDRTIAELREEAEITVYEDRL